MDSVIAVRKIAVKRAAIVCYILIIFILQLPININYYDTKRIWALDSRVRHALKMVYAHETKNEPIIPQQKDVVVIVDQFSYQPTKYYTKDHDDFSKMHKQFSQKRSVNLHVLKGWDCKVAIEDLKRKLADPILSGRHVWIIISKPKLIKTFIGFLNNTAGRILLKNQLGNATLLVLYQN